MNARVSHARRSIALASVVVALSLLVSAFTPRAEPAPQVPADRMRVFSTKHYDLWIEGAPVEAEEVGFVLEEAWRGFQSFYKLNPPEGTRLKVKMYATEDAFLRSAWSDDAIVPAQCRPSFWSDMTSTVYVYGPLGTYSTRKALIYSAALQFHALAKSKNKDLPREWYEAGLAHGFSRHTWDRKRLVMMTQPMVEPVDFPAQALRLVEDDPTGLPRQLDPYMPNPILCWAAVGLCRDGGHGRYRAAYEKYVLGTTGSKLPGEDFLRTLGSPNDLARALVAWLVDEQTPFEMLAADFEDRGGRTLVGTAEPARRAYCILKDADHDVIECTLASLPKLRTRAGLVTGYYAKGDYVLISVVAPTVDIHVWQDFKLVSTESIEIPGDHGKERKLKLTRKGPQAMLEVDGIAFAARELPQGRQGFFVEGGTATFRDVAWK